MSAYRFANWLSSVALLVLGAVTVSSCQDPTEITLEINTDVACSDLTQTSIAAGSPSEINDKDPATVTKNCSGGRVGSLVITPAAGKEDDVSMRVVTGVGKSLDACARDKYLPSKDDRPGTGCIVARRQLAYIEHKPLLLPVLMEQSCINVPCDERQGLTCVGGRCVSSKVSCDGDRCGIASRPDGGGGTGGTGGVDAGSGGAGGTGGGTGGVGADASSGGTAGTGGSDGGLDSGADPDGGDAGDSARCAPVELRLAGLTVSEGAIVPTFDPCSQQYALSVDLIVQSVAITAVAADTGSEVRVNGIVVASGTASTPVPLALGTNSIPIVVKSPSGSSNSYTLNVERTMTIEQDAYVKSDDPHSNDQFGGALAISGDTLVIGRTQTANAATDDGGRAYVFIRSGTSWQQQAVLRGSNTEAGDSFGIRVAISGDTIAIGADGESSSARVINGNGADNSAPQSGAAYVFSRTGTIWTQQAYVKASNADANDLFGRSVAISGDTLVVGAEGEASAARTIGGSQSDNTAPFSGAAYVFVRSGSTWSQQAYLKASNADRGDDFGVAVATSGDTIAVGAVGESSGITGTQSDNSAAFSGAAYVFVRSGTKWSQQAYLKASNVDSGDDFGFALALSGETLAVGAFGEASIATGINGSQADNSASKSGAVYVFARAGSTWSQQAYLKASNTDAGDRFGISVALSGETLAIGADREASAATGLNGDQADNSASGSGAAYVFERSGTTWKQLAYVKASNAEAGDSFGFSIALSPDTLAVGASAEASAAAGVNGTQNDNSAASAGAVYIFQ